MTKKQVHLLSIFSIFFFALTILVSCGAERNLKRGEKYLALGEYFDAANEFKQAYQKTPPKERERRGQIALKMALCYDKTLQTGKAVAAYRNVIRYKQDKIEEHLALARQLMKEGSYAAAEAEFKLVLDSLPNNTLAKEGLIAAKNAPRSKEEGTRYNVIHGAPNIRQCFMATATTNSFLLLLALRRWAMR